MQIEEYLKLGLCHSIHTSSRRAFRACRRRWDWVQNGMFYPLVTPQPLEFGVAFHIAMEKWYEPTMWNKSPLVRQAVALSAFKTECDRQLKQYLKLNPDPDFEKVQEYRESVELGLNMIKFYTERVSPVNDQDFTPVYVEVPFEVLITNPQGIPVWCKCDTCWIKFTKSELANDKLSLAFSYNRYRQEYPNDDQYREMWWNGLPVTYGGRVDMLCKDQHGRIWVFDWKSTKRILDEDEEASFLQLDDQVASYCWAFAALGLPVAGFVYVEIRKAYPKPPVELSRTYKGRKYSTDKNFFTTADLYENYVKENDPVAYYSDAYKNHIEWLHNEGPKFHMRHQIHKNEYELEEVGKNIYFEAMDMISNPRIYPQPGRFSCKSCLYRQPCLGKNMNEDWQYTLDTMFEKRAKHYYDIEPPSTERTE